MNDYDHVRDLVCGRVNAPGVEFTWLELGIEEIFQRQADRREFEVAEFSLAMYVALNTSGETGLTALPVFPSRMFRHAAIFVRPGEMCDAAELSGLRIGIPEWAQTAGVWVRGLLAEHHGVSLDGVEWIRGGVNKPGRKDRVALALPSGIRVTDAPRDRCLQDLLVEGEIDAIISAHEPTRYLAGDGSLTRLYEDFPAAERAYFAATGIYPIMHVVVVRSDVLQQNPWLARNLMLGFSAARATAIGRMNDLQVSRLPLPWAGVAAADIFGQGQDQWFAYGVEANRTALETFCRYAYEQGVAHRRVDDVADLFSKAASFEPQI